MTLQRLLLHGGFSLAFTASSDARSMQWRQDMVQTFLQRDLPQLGVPFLPPHCTVYGAR